MDQMLSTRETICENPCSLMTSIVIKMPTQEESANKRKRIGEA